MKKNLIKYLCCPINHDELKLINSIMNQDGEITEGKFLSSNGTEYLIENGIPNLIPSYLNLVNDDNHDHYRNVSESYVSILNKMGMKPYEIAKMDSLRFSIFSKTKNLCDKYLSGIVLEIGAGGDYLREDCRSKYDEWISLDYNMRSTSIDLRGDGQELPINSAMFDTIISIDVLEHVPNPENFISEMYRVIKPGGIAILSTPFFFYLHEEPNDFYRFSKYGLRTIFERNGFDVIEIIPTSGVIAIIGILITIFITRIFQFSKVLLKILLGINRLVQLKLFLPLDKRMDKNKRFAQGHFIIAKKKK